MAAVQVDDMWIDPGFLEEDRETIQDCTCGLCSGVIQIPTSGCPDGHSFCRGCYDKAIRQRRECPTCRYAIEGFLFPNCTASNLVQKMRVRCRYAIATKRAKVVDAALMPAEVLGEELRQRGLETEGSTDELKARLEKARKGGCSWKGRVGDLALHLGECEWARVKCLNQGCTESPLRKHFLEHDATCGIRKVSCEFCKTELECRTLAHHHGICNLAILECANAGCSVKRPRENMQVHRARCEHESVACPCPGCGARLLRRDMNAHVRQVRPKPSEP